MMNSHLNELSDRFARAFVEGAVIVIRQGFAPRSSEELMSLWHAVSPETCAEYQAIKEELIAELSQHVEVAIVSDNN